MAVDFSRDLLQIGDLIFDEVRKDIGRSPI